MTQSAFKYEVAPNCRIVDGATITETVFNAASKSYDGAVYDSAGTLVLHSVRPGSSLGPYRPAIEISRPNAPIAGADRIDAAIYGGHFFYAWGHFLIETLSTATRAHELPEIPVIFPPFEIMVQNSWTAAYHQHTAPLLAAAGWNDRKIIITARPMTVGRLFVPQRLTSFGVEKPQFHSELGTVFARIRKAFGTEKTGKTVVVMRGKDHRRRHPSEQALYRKLAASGADTIFPEQMSAPDQVAAISRARVLIGFSGSALHNSIFMGAGARVIEIGDQEQQSDPNRMQTELCELCGHGIVFVPGFEEKQRFLGGTKMSARSVDDLFSSTAAVAEQNVAI